VHQIEHVLVLILFLFKIDQKGKEVPNDFNLDIGATKKHILRGDKDDGLLSHGVWLASREPQ